MIPRIRRETTALKSGWTVRCPQHGYIGGHFTSRDTAEAIWKQHLREAHGEGGK